MKEVLLKLKTVKQSNVLLRGLFLFIASVLTALNFFIPQPPKSTIVGIGSSKSPNSKAVHTKTHNVAAKTSVTSPVITPTVSSTNTSVGGSISDSGSSNSNSPSQTSSSDTVSQPENPATPTPKAEQNEDQTFVPKTTSVPTADPNKNNAIVSNGVNPAISPGTIISNGITGVGNIIHEVGASTVGRLQSGK